MIIYDHLYDNPNLDFLRFSEPETNPSSANINQRRQPTSSCRVRSLTLQGLDICSAAIDVLARVPSGKHTENYGKSPFLMGKSTINGYFQ